MGNKDIINEFCRLIGSDNVMVDEPMKKHTTFRIGGPADYYLCPHSVEEVAKVIKVCKEHDLPYYVIGNGSNLLVGDKGYHGAVIQMYRNFSQTLVEGTRITVRAGTLLSQVAKVALDHGLSGFEFAAGIPGTMGGAVVMNAGAYGGEIKDILVEATVLDKEGNLLTLSKEELKYGYRYSVIPENEYIVLEAVIKLIPGERELIKARMDELREKRVSKQPLDMPSAGSTFKRPEGAYAGALIEQNGFRGYGYGGAKVSDKHCGFVVNAGEASAKDVLDLIEQIKEKVEKETGFKLEPEVKMIGEFE